MGSLCCSSSAGRIFKAAGMGRLWFAEVGELATESEGSREVIYKWREDSWAGPHRRELGGPRGALRRLILHVRPRGSHVSSHTRRPWACSCSRARNSKAHRRLLLLLLLIDSLLEVVDFFFAEPISFMGLLNRKYGIG